MVKAKTTKTNNKRTLPAKATKGGPTKHRRASLQREQNALYARAQRATKKAQKEAVRAAVVEQMHEPCENPTLLLTWGPQTARLSWQPLTPAQWRRSLQDNLDGSFAAFAPAYRTDLEAIEAVEVADERDEVLVRIEDCRREAAEQRWWTEYRWTHRLRALRLLCPASQRRIPWMPEDPPCPCSLCTPTPLPPRPTLTLGEINA
jgi:hypothetical protein